jgi:hypothetical protein
LPRALSLGAAVANPPCFFSLDGLHKRVVLAETFPGSIVEVVFLFHLLLGKQALGIAREIGDKFVVLDEWRVHSVAHGELRGESCSHGSPI